MTASGKTKARADNGKGRNLLPGVREGGGKTSAVKAGKHEALVLELHEKARLLEAQLLHAQRMESFSRLLPGVVHDFNHLLTHIIGYTELTLANLSPGDINQHHLERVKEAGKKATDLTRKLLSHCRQQELHLEVLDISHVVESAGRLFQRILGENIRIDFDLAKDSRPVRADAVQVEQILMNLVVNARDAMPGGGQILLETQDVELDDANAAGLPAGGYVVLAVEDSGPGIPPEIRDRIFEPFFTTKDVSRGTGLGLATVNRIVQSHQGHVRLTCKPGKGSRFSIYLPVAHERISIEEVYASRTRTGRGACRTGKRDGSVVVELKNRACPPAWCDTVPGRPDRAVR